MVKSTGSEPVNKPFCDRCIAYAEQGRGDPAHVSDGVRTTGQDYVGPVFLRGTKLGDRLIAILNNS
jgi:hypothetical protein